MSSAVSKTSPVAVVLVWAIVAIPLGWGLYQSVIKSKPLFAGQGHATPAVAPPASTASSPKS